MYKGEWGRGAQSGVQGREKCNLCWAVNPCLSCLSGASLPANRCFGEAPLSANRRFGDVPLSANRCLGHAHVLFN
jgi:hypothetical protein